MVLEATVANSTAAGRLSSLLGIQISMDRLYGAELGLPEASVGGWRRGYATTMVTCAGAFHGVNESSLCGACLVFQV